MESNADIDLSCNNNNMAVPSLKSLICKHLRPSRTPDDDERYFETNAKSLWSYSDDSDSSAECSEDCSPDEEQDFERNCKTATRKFVLKSPERQILMKEKEFLNHCNAVMSGTKRPQKSPDVPDSRMPKALKEESSKESNETEARLQRNLRKEVPNELESVQCREIRACDSVLDAREESNNYEKDSYDRRVSVLNLREGNAPNNFENDPYCRRSVCDLIRHFETINSHFNQKHRPYQKAPPRLPFAGGDCS